MSFEGSFPLETRIKKDLEKYRIQGTTEWFYREGEVFSYLQKLSTVEPQTTFYHDDEFVLLWRNSENSRLEFCPFCGSRHKHGKGDGHRVAHCSHTQCAKSFTRKSDGKTFKQSKGYFIQTKSK